MLERVSDRTRWYYLLKKDPQTNIFYRIEPKEEHYKKLEDKPIELAKVLYLADKKIEAIEYLLNYWQIRKDKKTLLYADFLNFLLRYENKNKKEDILIEIKSEIEYELKKIGQQNRLLKILQESSEGKRLELLDQYLKLKSNSIVANFLIGREHYKAKEFKIAREYFLRVLDNFKIVYKDYLEKLKNRTIRMHYLGDNNNREYLKFLKEARKFFLELKKDGFWVHELIYEKLDFAVYYLRKNKKQKAVEFTVKFKEELIKNNILDDYQSINLSFLILTYTLLEEADNNNWKVKDYEDTYRELNIYKIAATENFLEKNLIFDFFSQLVLAKISLEEYEKNKKNSNLQSMQAYAQTATISIKRTQELYPFWIAFYNDVESVCYASYYLQKIEQKI
ncbi:MAG: hypothetical protein N3D10_01825 [Candidatus Micrarchaeota archaeon]|nr:hypothetical protein [Candidatus Micrarchaeota archaeon]